MTLLSVLPAALVALVFSSPVFSALTSSNDLFKSISAHAIREPEPPICCLTPLPPVEPVEDEVLLSFEEWKEKQAALQASAKVNGRDKEPPSRAISHLVSGESASPIAEKVISSIPTELDPSPESDNENLSPHFQVPLTDRFNYASTDCSARVHLAHRSAKSPSSILSSKRDRYMLSPCSSPKENQFVVVELCEDIRIDTVQLANFEFFSGVFKDFSVSVAKTYKEDWVDAGTYRAKNVRGVQSFHPPTSLTGFYRFIRIDFHTHYSNEYYCPISLLRVYGLTHLEEWKWEIWEAESRAKREGLGEPSASFEVIAEEPLPVQAPAPDKPEEKFQATTLDHVTSAPSNSSTVKDNEQSLPSTSASPTTLAPFAWEQYAITTVNEAVLNDSPTGVISTPTTSVSPSSTEIINITASSSNMSTSTSISTPSSSSLPVVSVTHQVHSPPPPPATGGESIYRTIMNRLTALEANHTLYVRYVEEQTNGVREMIRRLGEDVGRLDGIGKAQAQKFQRSLKEWENQRKVLETEYNDLVARVEYLSDEIVLEKRLGIAQLCLLLAVIVFMGLTRGSRGESLEHGPLRFNRSMREWSRRHLSFSGDWVSRFTSSSRSRSPPRTAKSPQQNDVSLSQKVQHDDGHRVAFPALSARPRGPKSASHALSNPHLNLEQRKPKIQNVYLQSSRPRTPSLRNSRMGSRPTTPTSVAANVAFRPQMQRSNSLTGPSSAGLPTSLSWTGVGPVPKSAKRWARTAHLHEVKSPVPSSATAEGSSSKRSAKLKKDGTEEDEKENCGVSSSLAKSAASTKDKATSLDDEVDAERDVYLDERPSRPFSRPLRLGQSNGHLPPPILVTPNNRTQTGVVDQVQQSNGARLVRRWNNTSSSPSSPGVDGDDENLWVDTDTSVDEGNSSDIDLDFGFGSDIGS